jgi:hypothetical protein
MGVSTSRKVSLDEEASHGLNNPASQHENLFDRVVDNKIQVSLPVTGFNIRQSVPLFRKGPESFGKKPDIFGQDGEFACPGLEKTAFNADKIADVHELEDPESLFSHLVFPDVSLDPSAPDL